MNNKSKIILGMFFLLGVLFLNLFSAYSSSNPNYGLIDNYVDYDIEDDCSEGNDFLIQIAPFGCTPAVVRSDLLEEQNVPVFCQLAATQINPFIDVDVIDSISFSGDTPDIVSGVGFHPAQAALGIDSQINSPILENIGYAVIVLEETNREADMPDFVNATLTARIKYDVESAYNVGKSTLVLPVLTDEEWEDSSVKYSFWDGKGYLKAESVVDDEAAIAVYSDNRRIARVVLEDGETSDNIYIPGFDCLTGLELKLLDLVNPDTRAVIKVNGETFSVAEDEAFLDGKCEVKDLEKNGLNQEVEIQCETDDGKEDFELSFSPKIILEIDGEKVEAVVGDRLFSYDDLEGKKYVYLGYVGAERDVYINEKTYAYLYESPNYYANLTSSELSTISFTVSNMESLTESENSVLGGLKSLAGETINLVKATVQGNSLTKIEYSERVNYAGTEVEFGGFSNGGNWFDVDEESLDKDKNNLINSYETTLEQYDKVIDSYASEKYEDDADVETYGEEALREKIALADSLEQSGDVKELCLELKTRYPNVEQASACSDVYEMSNTGTSGYLLSIGSKAKQFKFEGITEPSLEDFSAEIVVTSPSGVKQSILLGKNQIFDLSSLRENSDSREYIQLVDLDEDTAKVKLSVKGRSIINFASLSSRTLKKDEAENFGSDFIFVLKDINLEKMAKVRVNPTVSNAATETNFSFTIGIEKRAFSLSPEQTRNKIDELNEKILEWEQKSEDLGVMVKALKTSCLAVGAVFTIKNFISNMDGTAIARKEVMRASGGWYDICQEAVDTKQINGRAVDYDTINECYYEEAENIDRDVENYTKILEAKNEEFEKLQEGITTSSFFGDDVVDQAELAKRYFTEERIANMKTMAENAGVTTVTVANKEVPISEVLNTNILDSNSVSVTELRDLEVSLEAMQDESLKNIFESDFKTSASDIYANSVEDARIRTLNSQAQKAGINIGFTSVRGKDVQEIEYSGGFSPSPAIGSMPANVPMQGIVYEGGEYLVQLSSPNEKDYSVVAVFDTSGNVAANADGIKNSLNKNFAFTKYDSMAYNNQYNNPEVKYFESEPYEGLPALVPFDLQNGWYASVKQTLGVSNAIASYDDSGAIKSFYICNVWENNREENRAGDDKCYLVNLGTGQTYQKIAGLSESESTKLVEEAVEAIEDVARAHGKGVSEVVIDGKKIKVGEPAVDVPSMQCQDFMSPEECHWLFNVCDPVICPSSRCDFGGSYPVEDVIQSGIIGSIVLCLPNFREGIYIPVCLSGIKAGIDSFLSVMRNHRDCLQESLDSGEMTGICDEIYSVYLCEFFWRQGLPLAQMAIPKAIEFAVGGNTRGGGEYMAIQSAWDTAEDSVDYFKNYYASNSFSTFNSGSAEEIGDAVCKSYVSGVYSDGEDILDSLTDPDSPPQFYGNFDEIEFSTATVPATSQYKVFYHIYAGENSRAYYQVYLSGSSSSSYYQGLSSRRVVASGYIAKGGYASETKDFTAPSGYQELCINVNGQEECGFEAVTTSFAVNYVKDEYLAEQASETSITSEADCISGTTSAYSLLSLNLEAGASDLIDPEIYNKGIVRICATDNPGQGTDGNYNTEQARWVDIGYCSDTSIRCWQDMDSVEDVITSTTLENEVLESQAERQIAAIMEAGNYLSEEDFKTKIEEIENMNNSEAKINEINSVIDKVFYSNQKAKLLLIKARVYRDLILDLYKDFSKNKKQSETISEEVEVSEENIFSFMSDSALQADLNRQCNCGENCDDYSNWMKGASEVTGMDSLLLLAIMMQESSCEADANSGSSVGLMQINENVWCGQYGLDSDAETCRDQLINDPETNIYVGAKILRSYYDQYKDGVEFKGCAKTKTYLGWEAALRAYNGLGCNPNYPEQDDYVEDVSKIYGTLASKFLSDEAKNKALEENSLNSENVVGNLMTKEDACQYCGEGIDNLCDSEECIRISELNDINCYYEDSILGGNCVYDDEGKKDSQEKIEFKVGLDSDSEILEVLELNGFDESGLESLKCDECGNYGDCDEDECNAISTYLSGINCAYEDGFLWMEGSCSSVEEYSPEEICESCGDGLDICNLAECEDIGKKNNINCVYEAGFILGDCIYIPEEYIGICESCGDGILEACDYEDCMNIGKENNIECIFTMGGGCSYNKLLEENENIEDDPISQEERVEMDAQKNCIENNGEWIAESQTCNYPDKDIEKSEEVVEEAEEVVINNEELVSEIQIISIRKKVEQALIDNGFDPSLIPSESQIKELDFSDNKVRAILTNKMCAEMPGAGRLEVGYLEDRELCFIISKNEINPCSGNDIYGMRAVNGFFKLGVKSIISVDNYYNIELIGLNKKINKKDLEGLQYYSC